MQQQDNASYLSQLERLGQIQFQTEHLPKQTLEELQQADEFYADKQFKKAEKLYRNVVRAFKKHYGKTSPQTIEIYFKIGKSLLELLKFESTDFFKMVLKNSNPDSEMHKLSQAHILFFDEDMEKALEIYQPIFESNKERYGMDDPRTMEIYNYMARAVYDGSHGDMSKSQQMYKKISQYLQKIKGPTDNYTLKAMNTLAYIYARLDQTEKALPLVEKILKYANRDLLFLGETVRQIEPEILIPIYEKALKFRMENFGIDEPGTIEIIQMLLNDLVLANNYERAIELYESYPANIKEELNFYIPFDLNTIQYHRKKLQQFKKKYGQQSTQTIDRVRAFADRLVGIDEFQKSIPYYEWVLQRQTDPDVRSEVQVSLAQARSNVQDATSRRQDTPRHRVNMLINNYISGQLSQQKFKSNPEITKQQLQNYLKTTAQTQQQLFQKLAALKQQRTRKIIQQAAQRSVAQQAQRVKKSKQTFTQQQLGQIKVMDFIMYDDVPMKEFLQQPNSIVIANKHPSGGYEFHGFLLNEPNMVYTCAKLSNQQYLRQKDGLTTPLITLKTDVEFRIPRDELLPKLKDGFNVFFVETSPEKVKIISKDILLGGSYVSGVHCTDLDFFNITHIVDSQKVGMFVPDIDLSYYEKK